MRYAVGSTIYCLLLPKLFFMLKIQFSFYLNVIYMVVKKIQGKNKEFILGSKLLTANTQFFTQQQCLDVNPFRLPKRQEVSTSCSSLFISYVLENASVLELGCPVPAAFPLHTMALWQQGGEEQLQF